MRDNCDAWSELKEKTEPPAIAVRGSKGVREYFAKKGVEVEKEEEVVDNEKMTIEEAANVLDLSPATVRSYCSRGLLAAAGTGYVLRKSVEERLRQMQGEETSKPNDVADRIESSGNAIVVSSETMAAVIREAYRRGREDALAEMASVDPVEMVDRYLKGA